MFNVFRQHRSYARLAAAIPQVTREERRESPRICKPARAQEEEFEELPRYGPLYSADESKIMKDYKKAAWERVLEGTASRRQSKSMENYLPGGDKSDITEDDHRSEITEEDKLQITESYLSAVGDVEREAIDCYEDLTMIQSETEFRWMMVKDGCFLIQLAILVLGRSDLLGYSKHHVIFGARRIKDKRWLKSMFYVGNQIPLVILRKLMKQPFFQGVLAAEGQWEEPPDLPRRVLYEMLIAPYTPKYRKYSDLLHSLYCFVIGDRKRPIDTAKAEDVDLESGDAEYVGDNGVFRCATQLSLAGIQFQAEKGMGCRGIDYRLRISDSVLLMPTLTIDDNTETMFNCLKEYETIIQPNRQKQAVCAYLKFMSELVQTTEDARLLASQGIINAADLTHKETFPQILTTLAESESSNMFWRIRLQTNQYSPPVWVKYKEIFGIVFLLTVLQTVFSVLGYFHDIKS